MLPKSYISQTVPFYIVNEELEKRNHSDTQPGGNVVPEKIRSSYFMQITVVSGKIEKYSALAFFSGVWKNCKMLHRLRSLQGLVEYVVTLVITN